MGRVKLYFLFVFLIFLSACSTVKFEYPSIKDDFCGVEIAASYCKCAFHGDYCESIGMDKKAADVYVEAEYDKWVDEKLKAFLAACALGGGLPDEDRCIHCDDEEGMETGKCYGVIEHGGKLYINSKPGQKLMITDDDLPEWAKGQLATVGASIAVVGSPDTAIGGDPNVVYNGLPVVREGDSTAHGGIIVDGSKNILVNGKPAAIIGSYAVDPSVEGSGVPRVGGPITG